MEVHLLNSVSNGWVASGKTRGYRYNDETRDNPEPNNPFGVGGAETKWLWGEPSDGRRILRYSPVPPERVCVGSATHSNDTGNK